MVNTDFPVKRYTAVQYTQPAAAISPLSKSTRHLLVPEPDPRYYYTHRAHQETITIDRDNLKHGKKKRNVPFSKLFMRLLIMYFFSRKNEISKKILICLQENVVDFLSL